MGGLEDTEVSAIPVAVLAFTRGAELRSRTTAPYSVVVAAAVMAETPRYARTLHAVAGAVVVVEMVEATCRYLGAGSTRQPDLRETADPMTLYPVLTPHLEGVVETVETSVCQDCAGITDLPEAPQSPQALATRIIKSRRMAGLLAIM